MASFERSFILHAPLREVWNFHSDPVALTQITPGPMRVQIVDCDYPVQRGSRVLMTMWLGPVGVRWNSTITEHVAEQYFSDEQITGQGPFKRWKHTHRFMAVPAGTLVTDHVEYALPLGVLGVIADWMAGRWVIRAMFNARARATQKALERTRLGADTGADANVSVRA
jgi:ligand-binding SRPBCC domain-containing protein